MYNQKVQGQLSCLILVDEIVQVDLFVEDVILSLVVGYGNWIPLSKFETFIFQTDFEYSSL